MSVFHEIDKALAKYEAELATVKEAVAKHGGRSVRLTETGWWRCSFRPTRGDRKTVRLKARSTAELIASVRAMREAQPEAGQ